MFRSILRNLVSPDFVQYLMTPDTTKVHAGSNFLLFVSGIFAFIGLIYPGWLSQTLFPPDVRQGEIILPFLAGGLALLLALLAVISRQFERRK